jgi:hypothetical protein
MLDQCQLEEKQKRDEALKTPDSKKAKVADLWCSQFNQNPECVTPGVIHLDLPSVKNR